MEYDPGVIIESASRLYKRADSVVASYTILGVLIGAGAGGALGLGMGALVGAVIIGVVGYYMGSEKAFQYRLQAQTALCQVKIESNTRAC